MDYKPSKQIRNICKFHTCKYLLFFDLLFYIYSKIINMHLSFKFLRETPRKRVLSINPGNYLSRRNTEKFHREISRRRFRLPGLFRGVSPRNKNFALPMVAEKRGICCYFFTGSVYAKKANLAFLSVFAFLHKNE